MNSDSDVGKDTAITPASNHHPAGDLNAPPEENAAENSRPSAIERQIAAIQSTGVRHPILAEAAPPNWRTTFFEKVRHSSQWGGRAAAGLLLIAAGAVMAYAFRADQDEHANSAKPAVAQIANPLQKSPANSDVNTTEPAQTTAASNTTPGANAAAPVRESAALSESDEAITVAISDISLRVRPELLQQLVAISRLRLTADPTNSHATATLSRLREHALAELDVISVTDSPTLTATSIELATRLFPELADNPRYRSIASRLHANEKSLAQAQIPAPPATTSAPATPQPTPTAKPALASVIPAAAAAVATPPASASPLQNPPVSAVASRKPQVRVISLTPGIINKKERFVPKNGGNIFRLNIGYRYRDEQLDNQPGSGLIAQLSRSGSSKVLAEVPVEVTGSKGEKSFLIGTFEKADMTKFYKLNFIVDGHVLPSHTVQLMPADFAGL